MRGLAILTSQWFSSFKHHAFLSATLVCLLSAAIPVDAGLLMDIASNSAAPGTSASFEVTLTNTGTQLSDFLSVSGFSFEITAAGTDVTFSDVTNSTVLYPYIFPGSDSLSGADTSIATKITNSGQTISALDIYAGASTTGVTLAAGETVSLGLVSYTLSSSPTSGSIGITFTPYPSTNVNNNDPDFPDLPVTLSNTGAITVSGVATVPEPSSLVSMLLGSFGIGVGLYRRRLLAI